MQFIIFQFWTPMYRVYLPFLFTFFYPSWVLSQRVQISHVITNFPSSSTSLRAWIGCVSYSKVKVNEYF